MSNAYSGVSLLPQSFLQRHREQLHQCLSLFFAAITEYHRWGNLFLMVLGAGKSNSMAVASGEYYSMAESERQKQACKTEKRNWTEPTFITNPVS